MNRRCFLGLPLLAALPSAFPSAPAQAASPAGLAIVLNSGEATLSLVDTARFAEIRKVPVLREPHHIALSPTGKDLLIGDSSGNEMLFLDPITAEIKRRMPIANPYHLAFSPNGKWLVVTGLARNQVDIYDAASMQLAKRFPIASMPSHVTYAPDSSVAYVTLQGTNKVAAFSLDRLSLLWSAESGSTPAGVVFHNGKLLCANMGTDYVAVMDPTDGRVERKIRTGRGAHQIFPSPDGKVLWVNNRVDGTTVGLDPVSLTPNRSFKLGGGPDCIDFAADGRLWVTLRFSKSIAVLDPRTGAIETLGVGRSPHGIWLTKPVRAA